MSNGEGPIERVPEQQYFVRVEVRLLTFCPSARSIVQHFTQPTRQVFTLKKRFPKSDFLAVTRQRGLRLLLEARVGNPTFCSGPRRDVRTMNRLGTVPNYQVLQFSRRKVERIVTPLSD